MKKRAEAALEMASNANQLARDALDEQVKKAERISMLRTHLEQLEGKLSIVQSLSLATLDDATQAYDQALNIYQEAFNLNPSAGDTSRMLKEVDGMREKAGTVRVPLSLCKEGETGEDEDAHRDEHEQQAELLVGVLDGEPQALETS